MTETKDTAQVLQEVAALEDALAARIDEHTAFVQETKAAIKLLKTDLKSAKKKAARAPRITEESPVVKKAVEILEQGVTRKELEQALDGIAKAGYIQSLLTGILAKKGYVLEATPDRRESSTSREKMYRIVGRR